MNSSNNLLFITLLSLYLLVVQIALPGCRSGEPGKNIGQHSGNEIVGCDTIYEIKQFTENVWIIDENGGVNMYLVIGSDSALLIDTGFGGGNLLECVRLITDLPLIVVNTHGHPDHSGTNYQFERIYAHLMDCDAVRQFSNLELGENMDTGLSRQATIADKINEERSDRKMSITFIPVNQGYIFDLGDRKLEVVEVPGHTPGSICLLDTEHKIIYTGDNNNTLVWLFLEGCSPLETYLQTLEKLKERSKEFNIIMPGHGAPLDKEFLDELITCTRNILNGNCTGEPYESFAGNGRVCYYKRAAVAYNPDNLYVEN